MAEKETQQATTAAEREPDVIIDIRVDAPQQAQAAPEAGQPAEAQAAPQAQAQPEQRSEAQANGQAQAEQPAQQIIPLPQAQGQPVSMRRPIPEAEGVQVPVMGQVQPQAQAQQPVEQRAQQIAPVEPAHAGLAGLQVRAAHGMEPDEEFLAQVLMRSLSAAARGWMTPQEAQELENVLKSRGLDMRALGIDTTGVVLYEEIARQFTVKALPRTIGRNHWRVVPMRNVKKSTFPSLDATGIPVTWGRRNSTTPTPSDATAGSFTIEVDNLEAFTEVGDDYVLFNPAGLSFTQQVLIPAIRERLQYAEDEAWFLATGTAPYSTVFTGLLNVTGVTAVAPTGANGDPLTLAKLDELIHAMPAEFADVSKLAFYLPWERALEVQELQIASGINDVAARLMLQGGGLPPGPAPITVYRGIPVYGVSHLPTNQTVGTSTNASTIFLVNRDVLAIGDAGTLRIEPIRQPGFKTLLQLQEWVGLGYSAWKTAIVRATGVLPKV